MQVTLLLLFFRPSIIMQLGIHSVVTLLLRLCVTAEIVLMCMLIVQMVWLHVLR
jgi:hypothetical protein